MRSWLAVLLLVAFASPASGAVLEQGDIVYLRGPALVRFDPDSGGREVISGCSEASGNCSANPGAVVGAGPLWSNCECAAVPQPDGSVIVVANQVAYRVSPENGDRAIIASNTDGGFPLTTVPYDVVPFFTPDVAALPAWGPPLVVGLLAGLSVRRRLP